MWERLGCVCVYVCVLGGGQCSSAWTFASSTHSSDDCGCVCAIVCVCVPLCILPCMVEGSVEQQRQ